MKKNEYKKLLAYRKEEEKMFFELIKLSNIEGHYEVRKVIHAIHPIIHYKRLWYILEKWIGKDIYNYGVTLDMGWLEKDKDNKLKGDKFYYEIKEN